MSESDRVVSFAQSHMCMGCFEVVKVGVLKVREWVSFHMNPEIVKTQRVGAMGAAYDLVNTMNDMGLTATPATQPKKSKKVA